MQIRVLVNEKLLPNKIGTNFGSVSNWLSSKTWFKYDALTIGNGATVYSWSDRYGATLVDIIKRNGKQFSVPTTTECPKANPINTQPIQKAKNIMPKYWILRLRTDREVLF